MATGIKVAGVWKEITTPSVNVSGVWKTVNTIYANVSGTWKQVWPDTSIQVDCPSPITVYDYDGTDPYSAQAYLQVNSDGDIYTDDGGGLTSYGTWLTAGAAADIEVMLSKGAGNNPTSGSNLETWYGCDTDPQWNWNQVGEGSQLFTGILYFRDAATTAALDSANVTISVECGFI